MAQIRQDPATFAPGGMSHLILEILASAADEAESGPGGRCVVARHEDRPVSVADDGRGTDTRHDMRGRPVPKPVVATKDPAVFDAPTATTYPTATGGEAPRP